MKTHENKAKLGQCGCQSDTSQSWIVQKYPTNLKFGYLVWFYLLIFLTFKIA